MRSQAGGGLVHPLPLVAVVVLVLNDHWWKQAHPSWFTGKLSDVAGLFFFPLLLDGLVEGALAISGRFRAPSLRRLDAMILLTGICFAWMKTTAIGGTVYGVGLGALQWPFRALAAWIAGHPTPALAKAGLVADPSDLVALCALLFTHAFGRARCRAPR